MPIEDRDYIRGTHPPYCTCKECTARRLGKLRRGSRSGRLPRRRQPNGALLRWVLRLVVVFILLMFGLVVWSLWGSQIAVFLTGLSPSPAVTEPLPQGQPTEVPRPTPTLPPVEPAPSLAPGAVRPPATPTVPSESVKPPEYQHEELLEYALELINKDREANGLVPVTLGDNAAAQKHAEERLANRYMSHWGLDGMKPYMRYTLAGGVNNEGENAFMTEITWSGGRDPSFRRDPKEMLEQAQEGLMNSPGHRKTILDKWYKKVNLGIAYDAERLDLVQQFEGDYIDFSTPLNISGDILSIVGELTLGTIENISLYYDPLPQPLTTAQLDAPPYDYAYGLGENVGTILSPPPSGYYYTDLSSNDVVATTWDIESDGLFTLKADVSPILGTGNGVYTVVVWVDIGGEYVGISNYSLFIE